MKLENLPTNSRKRKSGNSPGATISRRTDERDQYPPGIQEKNPHKRSSQEKTPQKSHVEKTPQPILGLVEKTPHIIFRLAEKTPQLYKNPHFGILTFFILIVFKPSSVHFIKSHHIGILTFLVFS